MRKAKQTSKKWPVVKLKPHPRQRELFDDLPWPKLQALAANIQEVGLQHPLEILPDGTVVCGHQRLRAVRLLDWTHVPVIVRHDLEKAGPEAVERWMIDDNVERRQLDPLATARCYERLKEIETGSGRGGLGTRAKDDLRDELAKRLGVGSGRTLDRYLQLLKLPTEIQHAYSRGDITMTLALQVAGLHRAGQEQIAQSIRDGGEPKKVIAEHLAALGQGRKRGRTLARTVERLQRAVADVSTCLPDDSSVLPEKAAAIDSAKSIAQKIQKSFTQLQRVVESLSVRLPNGRTMPFESAITLARQSGDQESQRLRELGDRRRR